MSALREALRSLAAVLDGRGLRWFVFGAQAVAVRAAPRATQDVDVVGMALIGEWITAVRPTGRLPAIDAFRRPKLLDQRIRWRPPWRRVAGARLTAGQSS